MPRLPRLAIALLVAPGLALATLTGLSTPASAHEERKAEFPDESGERPTFLGYDNPRARVVCKNSSAKAIAAMPDGRLKRINQQLLAECEFRSIQTAVNTIKRRNTSIYVLPGTYHETRWANKKRSHYCSHLETESNNEVVPQYIGSLSEGQTAAPGGETSDPIALSYADQRRCKHNLNLIALFGDETPNNGSIRCDSKYCGTQIVGTGRRMRDVLLDNRFKKLNAIRLDRMGGALLRNMTIQQAEFNAVYVLETDGFVIDRVTARANDEYGILAFASDHGLIQRGNYYYNGDSGVYPGSGSDLNSDNPNLEVTRYAIEIRRNRSHHNALGYSGTAGNSIWAHHNKFYKNATGIATDSLFPDHPGLPQDHARWNHNEIYSNNTNYYAKYVHTGVCAKPMPERGYMQGTVCPVIPTPVGTGVLIAGGNFNSTDHNWIYDNWRNGTMQFWVPAILRDEADPRKQDDTSHNNHTVDNSLGIAKDGTELPNGLDHWWDDQGGGNCWEDNISSYGEPTHNFLAPRRSCAEGGSFNNPTGTAPVKDAGFVSCSQYDRNDPELRNPPQCDWFVSPDKPSGESDRSATVQEQDSDALVLAPMLLASGLLLLGGVRRLRRVA